MRSLEARPVLVNRRIGDGARQLEHAVVGGRQERLAGAGRADHQDVVGTRRGMAHAALQRPGGD